MTCAKCGCTIGWDCECNQEYNRLVAESRAREDLARLEDAATQSELTQEAEDSQ